MASSKKPNLAQDPKAKDLLTKQIEQQKLQLQQRLEQYKNKYGKDYPINIVEKFPTQINVEEKHDRRESDNYDFINPSHYVQDDGKQTWERMVDKWGVEKTALWMEMTAFKYQDRIGKKPGEDAKREQDKIKWYEDKTDELKVLAKKKKFW
jgi:hypothetical protein